MKSTDKDKIEVTMVKVLKESNLSDISTDLADKLAEGLIGIPGIGVIAGLYKAAGTVSDYLFTKKLIRFLAELKDVPQEQRQQQIERLTEDGLYVEQVGERILLLLDKISDMGKPPLMGRAYRAFLMGQIDLDELRDLCHALDLLDLSYLDILRDCYDSSPRKSRYPYKLGHVQHLVMCGLLGLHFEPRREAIDMGEGIYDEGQYLEGGELGYSTNSLGELFGRVMFDQSLNTG
jgi:hypothetical protein